jgi:hypothetical protein
VVAGLLLDHFLQAAPVVSLFLCMILLAAWLGGAGPGLLATALSILALDYYFIPPLHSFTVAPPAHRPFCDRGSFLSLGLRGAKADGGIAPTGARRKGTSRSDRNNAGGGGGCSA